MASIKPFSHVYDNLYTPLANGTALRLSGIDFNFFALSDMEEFEAYFQKTLYSYEIAIHQMHRKLRELVPTVSKTNFI